MKPYPFALLLLFLFPLWESAASPYILENAETLLEEQKIDEAIRLLRDNIDDGDSPKMRARMYTLLSQCTLQKAAILSMEGKSKDSVLTLYSEGEQYADKAVHLDPSNHLAFFFRGSNAGMWGKEKGVFAALDRVQDMRADFVKTIELNPDFSFAWFSLGQMYRMVPGGIISFGDIDYAVSLGRKALDTMEEEFRNGEIDRIRYDYYVQLAISLHKRNWNTKRRGTEINDKFLAYHGSSDIMERGCNYEGVIDIPELSDREEAEALLLDVLGELKKMQPKTDIVITYTKMVEDTYDDLF